MQDHQHTPPLQGNTITQHQQDERPHTSPLPVAPNSPQLLEAVHRIHSQSMDRDPLEEGGGTSGY